MGHRFLQSLFSYHIPPPLCLSHPHELPPNMGCPFESRNKASSPFKKGAPSNSKLARCILFATDRNSHPIWGALLRMVDRHLYHSKRAPPSNAQISCKQSFPTHPPPLCLSSTFPTEFCSLPCPHRSHGVLRDTHLPFTPGRTLLQWPPNAHLPFLEELQPLFASRCPLFPTVDINFHPWQRTVYSLHCLLSPA